MSDILDSRYGKGPARAKLPRSFWVTLTVLASLLGIAFVWWAQSHQISENPEFKDVSHNLTSNDRVSLTFQVVKAPESTAVCTIKALNEASAPVGWSEVMIGPNTADLGDTTVRQQTAEVRVLSEATTVTVDRCWKE
ncbi:DUF4307 domain-containing protein [uncultured Rothia sp.]|uniref:DUF4307 domain-containing protein n=1 Tax=uncultured Rothia sp. TaxID=316088 RepID=UPI003217B799